MITAFLRLEMLWRRQREAPPPAHACGAGGRGYAGEHTPSDGLFFHLPGVATRSEHTPRRQYLSISCKATPVQELMGYG
jgi:hypothetical protein